MLHDPVALGSGGFLLCGSGKEAPTLDLAALPLEGGPGGLAVEKKLQLPPGYTALRLEGAGSATARVFLDGLELPRDGLGNLPLPPFLGEQVLLRLVFEATPGPITDLWLLA